MLKSKIAVKLAAYFALAIFVFALVMASSFGHFFRESVIERQQKSLMQRAQQVASIMGDNLERSRLRGERVNSPMVLLRSRRLIRYVNVITADDVWVASKDGNVEMRNHIPAGSTPAEMDQIRGQVERPKGPQGRDLPPVLWASRPLRNCRSPIGICYAKG